MQRALVWLNLYGLEAVRHKLKNSLKTHKKAIIFCLLLSLCLTSRPYLLSHTNALCINQFYQLKDQSMKFSLKNIENWQSPENDFCLVFWFLVFGYWVVQKNFFLVFLYEKKPRRFIWGSIYSCSMDGFFRIFQKAVSKLICTRL